MTLRELQTVYSLEDLYAIIEVQAVNAHNARVTAEREAERRKREQQR